MTEIITPHDYETLFHLVANARMNADGDHFEYLGELASKVAAKSETGLRMVAKNSLCPDTGKEHSYWSIDHSTSLQCLDCQKVKVLN